MDLARVFLVDGTAAIFLLFPTMMVFMFVLDRIRDHKAEAKG